VSYPQITDYQDAVQDPRHTFTDPELKIGSVALSPLGLPQPMSGGFALTYKVQSGAKRFAVRCFHREVPQAQARYAQISTKLQSLASPYFVNFEFQGGGIRIHGKPYPVVKMDWVDGLTLGEYLDVGSLTPLACAELRRSFATLADFLERNGVAHGDIQNENVIVSGGAWRLIDYDGMYVTGMAEGWASEVGHKHFQHPGRTVKLFGPKMDRFSFIVLDVSFEAMAADPLLHRKFREGGQAIIFKANDFADPSSSEVFRILSGMPAIRESAKKLAAVCGAPVTSVPILADFKAGRNIPIPAVSPIGTPAKPAPAHIYIGAFTVVDAQDFNAVLRQVGDKIELVGQILSVKEGIGKRGRGRGRPYVFINFGIWNKDSVKITIWSEGLGNMSTRPTEAWTGRWVSVTGLVEPPYEGKHYGKPYRNIGITVTSDNQIIQILEQDAKFRLGRGVQPDSTDNSRSKNAGILDGIRGVGTREGMIAGRGAVPPPSQSPKTKNEQILKGLVGAGAQGQGSGQPYTPSPRPTSSRPGLLARIPGWLWVAGGLLLIFLLSRGR
jgi:serine/threonine protein kinase